MLIISMFCFEYKKKVNKSFLNPKIEPELIDTKNNHIIKTINPLKVVPLNINNIKTTKNKCNIIIEDNEENQSDIDVKYSIINNASNNTLNNDINNDINNI